MCLHKGNIGCQTASLWLLLRANTSTSMQSEPMAEKPIPNVSLLPAQRLDRLDIGVAVAVAALILAIALVLLSGDRVGISVRRFVPQGLASSQSVVQITFDEPLDPESVADKISLSPAAEGTITVTGNQLQWQPTHALQQGQIYTVRLAEGVRAQNGRLLLEAHQWEFRVRAPQVVFMAPVDNPIQNLFMVDPNVPDSQPQQITFSELGVLSYDIAPDGSRIVYSELGDQRTAHLRLYDLRSNSTLTLLECPTAACTTPAWRPDGGMVAFERSDLNLDTGAGPGAPRIWLVDTTTGIPRPLFADSQRLGYSPRWSPDGRFLASYDANVGGIVLFDFEANAERLIRTPQGEVGQFSADGRWLFFPKIIQLAGTTRYVAHFVLVDLESELMVQRDLVPESDPNNDVELAWLPDNRRLVITRRPPTITTMQGAQLHLIDLETNETTPLVTDGDYSSGQVAVSPNGEQLAFQRFALAKPGARAEIWLYDLTTGDLRLLASNATLPRWLP